MESCNSIYSQLRLGDIIQIIAPSNKELNDNIFIIEYIDETIIKLKQPNNDETIELNINSEGNLTDESIKTIEILNRAESNSYAKQNNLIPSTFVTIYFGGDVPETITGEITNLEEDMIEIKLIDTDDLIYIDFAYKGLPKDIPIDKIVIRPKPESQATQEQQGDADISGMDDSQLSDDDQSVASDLLEEDVIEIPTTQIKTQIKDMIFDADQIIFGNDLEEIKQIKEVPEEKKRYSIETQVSELFDELISTVPSNKRTVNVMNSIHREIERFKQLRSNFSLFDDNGNANKTKTKGADYKPMIEKLKEINFKLSWIVPIPQNYKKIYDVEDVSDDIPDIISLTLASSRIGEYDIRELYKTNTDNFYTYMRKMQPYLTPFDSNNSGDILTSKHVKQNIDVVVDNLNNFYSSISKKGSISRKKFLISRYNLGLNKLQGDKNKYSLAPMTDNDKMNVKSFITLPKSTMQFSNIHLPNTNIYDKSNLNLKYLNYWKVFRENQKVATTFIDNINSNTIAFDENNYLKYTTQYILSDENDDPDKLEKYLNIITPKTRVLFNLIKKYIDGNLSFVSVVNYLQPFLIYLNDISFKQYEEIMEYIENKILEYKQGFIKKRDLFSKLSTKSSNYFVYESLLYKILKGRHDLSDSVLEEYGFNSAGDNLFKGNLQDVTVLSNSEIIIKMMNIDYTKFYNTAISALNNDLLTPFDFDELLNQKEDEFNKNIEKEKASNECKQYVLTKRYIDLDELNADNGNTVYFDKKYDPTVYDIISEYDNEQTTMEPVAFKTFLIDQLIKNIGLKRPDARYEAVSMIEGKRAVQDGQYAVLEVDNIDSVQYYYYKREENQWIRDESIPDNSFFGTNKLFCNIQDKCIKIDKTCSDPSLASELVKKNLVTEMYNEFDDNYKDTLEQHKKMINNKFKYQSRRIIKLKRINRYILYKYELDHLKSSFDVKDDDELIISPHKVKLNAILGQSDIIKKQNNIVKFVTTFTRPAMADKDEKLHWLYCIDTNTPILPTFVSKLASVFVLQGDYMTAINDIKTQQGINSDDKIVDKYSGWPIEKIALNTDEEYDTATGFKIQSKELLEMDAGAALLQDATVDPKKEITELLSNPKGKMINNVITTVTNYMGIIIDKCRVDIIKHTLLALDKTVDSKEVYDKKIESLPSSRKKPKTYEEVFYTSLLTFTLSYMVLFIQTSIPSIQSKKTFPGCKKSFQGYPLTGDEDMTNIEYIACISSNIKSSIQPWKSLPKKQDKISTSIKKTLDTVILKETEILALIEQKRNYLLLNEDDNIPIELDIKNWINFLPPLQNITNKTPNNLSPEFRTSFLDNIKSGSKTQFEQYNIIKSKAIYFSMAIIQAIHKIVEKEKLLLTNNSNIPFLQNACCNTGDYKTIDYFINKDSNIINYNNIVSYLYDVIFDMINMSQPTMLLDPKNTKIIFPELSSEFSENTMYRAFIEYCNFNSDIPISDTLLSICLNKPDDYDKFASLEENIKLLKKEGKNYSTESFNELINIVNRTNIVPLDLVDRETSNIHQIRDLLTHMIDSNDEIGIEFLTLFKNTIDSYDISKTNETGDIRDLRNYMGKQIDIYTKTISDYINKYADSNATEKANTINCITGIMDFHVISSNGIINDNDSTLYKSITFIKDAIFSFINVFTNIIKNKVDYEKVKIPTHWNISDIHVSDVKSLINLYYLPLKSYYGDTTILSYLNKFEHDLQNLYKLISHTNLYANITTNTGDDINSILDNRTIKQMFELYFLYMIDHLIKLTDDLSFIDEIISTPKETEDIITTDVELQEDATGELPDIDITRGEQRKIKDKIADLITTFMHIICKSKNKINYSYDMIKEKINRAKDKERSEITTTLGRMDKEARQIENLFKNHRLERWNKGLQKGLTQYVAKTYDEEREEKERRKIMEMQLEKELLDQTIIADSEIQEREEQTIVADRIEEDAYSMSDIPDDDEMGEYDDIYMLEHQDDN